MKRSMWKAIGVLAAVFVLGAVTGGAGVAAWNGEERISVARLGYGPRGERPLQAMTRRLDLNAEQRHAIRALMEKHAPRRRAIMQEMMGSCGQELQKEKSMLDDEIRAVLTPEQRKRFDELSERQRERLFGPSSGPPRHRGP